MKNNEEILILDFYGQYNQLIARRVRECNVYSEIVPFDASIEKIKKIAPKGIIFTGGPSSVYEENAPRLDKEIFELGIPILGICYGMQLISYSLGGNVQKAEKREYGTTTVNFDNTSPLFKGFSDKNDCLMSHTDFVEKLPEGFKKIADTSHCPIAGMANDEKKIYGIQFHPEVNHTQNGTKIISNFLDICGCKRDWNMSSFVEESVKQLKEKIGDKKALCALSGGVDSSVAAVLLNKAIGKNLTCIFVDHGLLRKNEGDEVEHVFRNQYDINLIRVNAKDRFLSKLAGITDPEKKRKIIGEEFIRVFEEEAKKIGKVDFLVQGTIYPDVIESGGSGKGQTIKSHHNVGGLPDYVDFEEIIEPLRDLFKDEVRKTGLELGIPENLVYRQPFPGPGLAIRVIGDITDEKLEILKEADFIFREEIANAGLDRSLNQYFAVLTNLKSVGVMGDGRTYDYTLALRAVETSDFMTATWAKIPYEILEKVSSRIVNEIKNINRVVYDITSKPPATIEWE